MTSIDSQLENMQESYESLANMLSIATVTPETVDKRLARMAMQFQIAPRAQRDLLQQRYVTCTKQDVAMNALMMRAKHLGSKSFASLNEVHQEPVCAIRCVFGRGRGKGSCQEG